MIDARALAECLTVMAHMEEEMSAARKTWVYFDENDNFLFAAEELSKWSPKIGGKVRSDDVEYTIRDIEDGRGIHNVRLDRGKDYAGEHETEADPGEQS